ncbi:hypothetical protein [Ancylobacter amanitiformis]|uniref:IrrE N-terminal-like domain-containing protein n=1 Tax=Ancylobacter amanitiformis TaxID=217069 RepID=A0ABU0LLK8_9HYPH|nr:hypothetical protein [Ancylobacter amanitiformis]MDQ0509586.1 hypothetical protein [Ancylobacter amanitiformis]
MMSRRCLLSLFGGCLLLPFRRAPARADAARTEARFTLLTAPLQLGGDWGGSAKADAAAVIGRMRLACLAGVALVSDQQPERLRVDDKPGGYPSVWLHSEDPATAWVTVIVGPRDWCNLAYQFGHELGHVLCNSWKPNAAPRTPCQWVEEALVEAFSLHGLGRLAHGWGRSPPFPGDGPYADSIRSYRDTLLAGYRATAQEQGMAAGFGSWFAAHEAFFEAHGGLVDAKGAVSTLFGVLVEDPASIADLGALNRWPERSGIALPDYLDRWEESCAQVNAPGRLPRRIRQLLAAG